MSKIIVGVLRGGPSLEHEVSIKTGQSVLDNLPDAYIGRDIFISKDNHWHIDRKPTTPDRVFHSVDVVFNALHGQFGEDGKVQRLMEIYGVPYTGAGVAASALGMNKILAREAFKKVGLKLAMAVEINAAEQGSESSALRVFKAMPPPWVVKPAAAGSSVGVRIVKTVADLSGAISEASEHGEKVLIEEFIPGKEATCGVLENFRGQNHYALPVVEIIPPSKFGFFNYDAKYSGETKEICPSGFELAVKRRIEELAKVAHSAIGCRHYSRSDFIVSKKGIYILEINTLPGLTAESLLPKAMAAVGSSHKELIGHLLKLALLK